MRLKQSPYMHWAKTGSKARFNLATSGVGPFPLRDLAVSPDELEINGDNSYGYKPLLQAIAAKSGVDPDCVVTAAGTSMANYLAMAALIEPGDEVLIEHPTYELIVSAAANLGANVKRFARREEDHYALDPAEVRHVISPDTKLIVVTNLHNPTGVLAPDDTLRELAALGPPVLVDEVYLDAVCPGPPRTSFHLGPNIIVTSSLTKVYGLSGLRCGWILAQPDLARSMWRLNDLFAATPVHPGELLSVAAFGQLEAIRNRALKVLEADRNVLTEFLEANKTQVSTPPPRFGTTALLRLLNGDVEQFLTRLRSQHDTSAVPGHFFEMPNHFRIGMGVDSEMFKEGMKRLEANLKGPATIVAVL